MHLAFDHQFPPPPGRRAWRNPGAELEYVRKEAIKLGSGSWIRRSRKKLMTGQDGGIARLGKRFHDPDQRKGGSRGEALRHCGDIDR